MNETSILDMSDDTLVTKGIIRMTDVIPRAFWGFAAVGYSAAIAAGIWCFTRGYLGGLFAAGALVFFMLAIQVVAVRALFILHRSQLEARILVTQMPREAASLVVKHMTPSGLSAVR